MKVDKEPQLNSLCHVLDGIVFLRAIQPLETNVVQPGPQAPDLQYLDHFLTRLHGPPAAGLLRNRRRRWRRRRCLCLSSRRSGRSRRCRLRGRFGRRSSRTLHERLGSTRPRRRRGLRERRRGNWHWGWSSLLWRCGRLPRGPTTTASPNCARLPRGPRTTWGCKDVRTRLPRGSRARSRHAEVVSSTPALHTGLCRRGRRCWERLGGSLGVHLLRHGDGRCCSKRGGGGQAVLSRET